MSAATAAGRALRAGRRRFSALRGAVAGNVCVSVGPALPGDGNGTETAVATLVVWAGVPR